MGSFKTLNVVLTFIVFNWISLSQQKSIVSGSYCNPPGDPTKDQFIIGYGSLINSASKNRTFKNTGENLPVLVSGYSRVWNCKGVSSSLSTTYLGIVPKKNGTLNGVVFKIPNRLALDAYDEREIYYCRELVPETRISLLVSSDQSPAKLPIGQYWIYITKPQYTAAPSIEYPIVQSYVDTFLSGCLQMQKKYNLDNFSDDCVKTTVGWGFPWINDRIYPRRPFMHQPMAGQIDKLIVKLLPDHYKGIKVE